MSATESPFLAVPVCEWLCSNDLAFAVFDGFPVSPGHVLVVTRRIVETWFDATEAEQAALMGLVNEAKRRLDGRLEPKPDGYNLGFNCGAASGQTVPHVHIHVIPRYVGDMADPRGGVRHVIPGKGNYLAGDSRKTSRLPALTLATGHPTAPLWRSIVQRVAAAEEVDLLASFIQPSGLDLIQQSVFAALRAEAIGVANRSVERAIWRIQQDGGLRRIEPGKGGAWGNHEVMGEPAGRLRWSRLARVAGRGGQRRHRGTR